MKMIWMDLYWMRNNNNQKKQLKKQYGIGNN